MVSFSCEICNDTVIKKKLDQHKQRCYGAYYTCIDCSITFQGNDYKNHTSCITEAEKYEKGLYKGKKQQQKPNTDLKSEPKVKSKPEPKPEPKPKAKTASKSKTESKTKLDFGSFAKNNDSLYKVLKTYSKQLKMDKKELLKQLKINVNENGDVIIKLD